MLEIIEQTGPLKIGTVDSLTAYTRRCENWVMREYEVTDPMKMTTNILIHCERSRTLIQEMSHPYYTRTLTCLCNWV